MKLNEVMDRDGIATRWLGGPLGGKIIKVPVLDEVLTVHPEDNQRSRHAGGIRHVHKYVLHQRITLDGLPTYRYAGVERGD